MAPQTIEVTAPEKTEVVTVDDVLFKEALTEAPPEALILENAADILESGGWSQGSFNAWGNRCAVGGIGAAVNRMKFMPGKKAASRRAAEKALADLIAESHPNFRDDYNGADNQDVIIRFNDSPRTTKAQVVRRMREAAARLTGR